MLERLRRISRWFHGAIHHDCPEFRQWKESTYTRACSSARSDMRVLYTCVRGQHRSTGYPIATRALEDFFCSAKWISLLSTEVQELITNRLSIAFSYAMSHWESVGKSWTELFVNTAQDISVHEKLSQYGKTHAVATEKTRVLVLVVDEARSLLAKKSSDGVNFVELLCRGLREATKRATKMCGPNAGVFGILVDTSPKIIIDPQAPQSAHDASSHSMYYRSALPEFILTHTLDIHHKQQQKLFDGPIIQFYQNLVLKQQNYWQDLVRMGRPLWQSVSNSKQGLVKFSASKLLCGADSTSHKEAFSQETLYGVASLLCRLGIRLHSTSSFTSHLVADFMSVLSYVSLNRENHISGYSSDPILTFGAAYLWYNSNPNALSAHILPEFKKLAGRDAVDTSAMGLVVARIVLLMAMDACRSLTLGEGVARGYSGEFCSVMSFLGMLHGPDGATRCLDETQARMNPEWKEDLGNV